MREIVSVKNAIEAAITKSRKLKESILKARWHEVVGEMCKKSTLLYLKEGVIYSVVEGPAFIQHMSMSKSRYIENANTILEGNYVSDMRFKLGKISIEEFFQEDEENPEEEMVDIRLDEEEREAIRKASEDIEDESIRERIIHLKEEALKRDKYLSQKGYKKCKRCGSLYKRGSGDICSICENKQDKDREEKVFKIFSEDPYTGYDELKAVLPQLTREEYKRYKQRKLDKIYRRAYFLLTEGMEGAAIYTLYDYFRLETGNRSEYELDAKSKNLVESMKEKIAGR